MTSTFTITSARNAGEKDNPHGGKLVKWYLKLADSEAGNEDVYCQKKPGNDLSHGMAITGRLEKGEYGWRLFPETERGNFKAPSYQRDNGLSKDDYWRNKEERDIVAQARMGRAHAEEMGLRALNLFKRRYDEAEADELRLNLLEWTEFFHRDVQRFPLDADVGGEERPSHSPAADVNAEASPQLKGDLTKAFHKIGLSREAMKAVVLVRCRAEKATTQGARQLIRDIDDGADYDALIGEVWDAKRAGDPVGIRAAKLIPENSPVDTEGLPELDAEGKQILGIKDESDAPF